MPVKQQFFYDKQIRRYIQQFIRLFSGFSVQMGHSDDKLPIFYTCDDNIASILEGADNELTDDIRTVVRKGSSVLFGKLVARGMSITEKSAPQALATLDMEAI